MEEQIGIQNVDVRSMVEADIQSNPHVYLTGMILNPANHPIPKGNIIDAFIPDLANGTGIKRNEGSIFESLRNPSIDPDTLTSDIFLEAGLIPSDNPSSPQEYTKEDYNNIRSIVEAIKIPLSCIKRYPAGGNMFAPQDEFEHSVTTSLILSKDLNRGIKGLYLGLTHCLRQLPEKDRLAVGSTIASKLPENVVDEIEKSYFWYDFIDGVGKSFLLHQSLQTDDTEDAEVFDEDFIKERVERGLNKATEALYWLRESGELNSLIDGHDGESLSGILSDSIQDMFEKLECNFNPKDESTQETLSEIFVTAQLIISSGKAQEYLLAKTADMLDDLKNPLSAEHVQHNAKINEYAKAYPERFEDPEEPVSMQMYIDLDEADLFYLPCLELFNQTALRALDETVMAWKDPVRFSAFREAERMLSDSEDDQFFDNRSFEATRLYASLEQYVGEYGKIVSEEEFNRRYALFMGKCGQPEDCIANAHHLLEEGEYTFIRPRRKGRASLFRKINDSEDDIKVLLGKAGIDLPKHSPEYYRYSLMSVSDLEGGTVLVGSSDDENYDKDHVYDMAKHLADYAISLGYLPYKGFRPDKYDRKPGKNHPNDPVRAIRVYDKVEDHFFNTSICLSVPMEGIPENSDHQFLKFPGRQEIQFKSARSEVAARTATKAAHFIYKLESRKLIHANVLEKLPHVLQVVHAA